MVIGFEQSGATDTIKDNGINVLNIAEKVAQKNQPNGYAGLDNNQKVVREPTPRGANNDIAFLGVTVTITPP